jgi:short-subunit dehydrogenase
MTGSQRRLALITGASAGLGAAFARAYARRGVDVALVARREERLRALADDLGEAFGVEAIIIPQDLAADHAEDAVMARLGEAGRAADVLVNNAGLSIAQDFTGVAWARQRDMLMSMVVAPAGLTHAVLPGMVARGWGRILNIASVAAFAPGIAGHSLYPGVKSLAVKFSQALAAEVAGTGVKVTALCPGSTRTEFTQANGTAAAGTGAPGFLVQTAEAVAEFGVRASEAGRLVAISGWHNRLAVALLKATPSVISRPLLGAGARRFRLPPADA